MEGATNMLTSALSNVITVFNQAVTLVMSNDVAMVYIGIPLIGAGIGLLHCLAPRRR